MPFGWEATCSLLPNHPAELALRSHRAVTAFGLMHAAEKHRAAEAPSEHRPPQALGSLLFFFFIFLLCMLKCACSVTFQLRGQVAASVFLCSVHLYEVLRCWIYFLLIFQNLRVVLNSPRFK